MPFCTGRPCLWPLILSLCLTSVTSLNFIQDSPKTWWVDGSCIQKRFTPITARETFQIATLGARRLLNLNDQNQGWVFNLLFKSERDFSILAEGDTEAWNVVEFEGWIGAMLDNHVLDRDLADVRIYCDNDERWTRVPDDRAAFTRGFPLNSLREFGDTAEYEDPINFMRRNTWNEGCQQDLTLGVTYSTPYPISDTRVPQDYHKPRQTITICDLAFRSPLIKFADIRLPMWRTAPIAALNTIPTYILLYQLLNLEPYLIQRDLDMQFEAYFDSEDLWRNMLQLSAPELTRRPAPYTWNAVLAYAASIGWGIQQGLTQAQYIAGQELFRYSTALLNPPFIRGGPITLPARMGLPGGFFAGSTG